MLKMYCDGVLMWEAGTQEENLMAYDPKMTDELRKVPVLTFSVPKTNIKYGEINPFTSRILVEEDGVIIFYGRPLVVEKAFDQKAKVTCENALGFLRDVYSYNRSDYMMRESSAPITALYGIILNGLPLVITGYNPNCDQGNQILRGSGIEDSGRQEATVRLKDGRTYLDFAQLIAEDYGLTVWCSWEYENGSVVSYLNFAECALMENAPLTPADNQKIVFGKNLRDLTEDVDTLNVFTKIRGYDTTNSVWFDYKDDAHVAAYGSVTIGKDFDLSDYSSTDSNRQKVAKKYYDANAYPIVTRSVKAVDMVDAGVTGINRFRVGFYYDVVSPPHGINERMMCQKITRYLDKPGRSSYEFGQTKRTLTNTLAGRN